jgi:hypothetical protein
MTANRCDRTSKEDSGKVGRIDADKASGEIAGPRHRLLFGIGVVNTEAADYEEEDDGVA